MESETKLMSKEQRQKQNWEKLRGKGLFRFILEIGILKFGIPTTVLTQSIVYFLEFGFTSSGIGGLFTGIKIFTYLISILIGGVTFGFFVWFWAERKYQKPDR